MAIRVPSSFPSLLHQLPLHVPVILKVCGVVGGGVVVGGGGVVVIGAGLALLIQWVLTN